MHFISKADAPYIPMAETRGFTALLLSKNSIHMYSIHMYRIDDQKRSR